MPIKIATFAQSEDEDYSVKEIEFMKETPSMKLKKEKSDSKIPSSDEKSFQLIYWSSPQLSTKKPPVKNFEAKYLKFGMWPELSLER